jgi:Na+/proline symporter
MGRLFVVLLTLVAYAIVLRVPRSIFDLASQFAFAVLGAGRLVAALFWRRSTRGPLAVVLWVAAGIAIAVIQMHVPPPAGPATVL